MMSRNRLATEQNGITMKIMSFPIDQKFIKFLFVGVMNTLFSYSVYSLFLFLNVHYIWATTLASGIGALFNFKTIGLLVFKNNDNKLLARFLGMYVITWAITACLLWFCAQYGLNLYLAGFMLAFPVAALSFLMQSRFVFVTRR